MIQENAFWQARKQHGVLIAAHRGVSGGNIPCNTLPAFEAALRQGAHILEADLTVSRDGEVFIFHPGQEKNHLNLDIHLGQMDAREIHQLRYVNMDNDPTPYGLITLDAFLEQFRNRCLINLDHGWDDFPRMLEAVRRHGMEEQVLLKAPAKMAYAEAVEALAPDMAFMPIYKEQDCLTPQLEKRKLNYVGAELVFAREDSPLAQAAYIQAQHQKGRLVWCNAILYSYKAQLSGGHTDDLAVSGDPDGGWGWLIDRGFDIIQTDWVLPLRQYINHRKTTGKGDA